MLVSGSAGELPPRPATRWARRLAAVSLAVGAMAVAVPVPGGLTRPTCVDAAAAHHAALVVEHGNGAVLRFCVGFDQDRISGQQLLDLSGVAYQAASFGSLGKAVCQIDAEPASYPPTCWTSTSPYWAIFVSRGGGSWSGSSLGISAQTFADGDAEGFRYDPQNGGGGAPPSAAGVCAAATAPPAVVTATPAAGRPAPTGGATRGPGSTGTAPSAPAPTPTSSSSSASANAPAVTSTAGGAAGGSPAASAGGGAAGLDAARVSPGLLTASVAFGGLLGLAGFQLLRGRRSRPGRRR